ncbi:MAG: NADP-dependent phosphogluconate dehydrogenase [Pseudomonadota bacterium]|nr:NADP-dependent phosphogluconate dehydrogenase [Pseudomonadota bacterium]
MVQEIGLIGLGRIGRNLAANLIKHGVSVQAWDKSSETCNEVRALLPNLNLNNDIQNLIRALHHPRCVMLVVPDGDAVDQCINKLSKLLEEGDIIIDSGNSHFRDTEVREKLLLTKGIHFLGIGISGGPQGARCGPSFMVGGQLQTWQVIRPLLESISAQANNTPCAGYVGKGGAGHFIKIVHNGIEYAIMQILADVFELLSKGCDATTDEITKIFQEINKGVTAGFLVEAAAQITNSKIKNSKKFLIDSVDDRAEQKGTGNWAVELAFEMGVSVPTISAAVQFRTLSSQHPPIKKTINIPMNEGSIPVLPIEDIISLLSPGITCAFLSAYAQGFSLIGAAKNRFGTIIDNRHVAQIWGGGCILRSELINLIAKSQDPKIDTPNILQADNIQPLVLGGIAPLRELIKASLSADIPVPGLYSAAAYIDSLNQVKLSTRFIQLQRDYFGSHGFFNEGQKTIKHGPWKKDNGL